MVIHENRTLGIDLGIASCGWAVIEVDDDCMGRIVAMGSRTWDAPETDKERTPTNQLRRGHRGMRRVLKRRRQRMSEIRRLFRDHGLIEVQGPTGLRIAELNPWTLRAEGLDRKLTGHELAVALGHIAKHRGFKSKPQGRTRRQRERRQFEDAQGDRRDARPPSRISHRRTDVRARRSVCRSQAQPRWRVYPLDPSRRSGARGHGPVRHSTPRRQSAGVGRTGRGVYQDRLLPTTAPRQRAPHRPMSVRTCR